MLWPVGLKQEADLALVLYTYTARKRRRLSYTLWLYHRLLGTRRSSTDLRSPASPALAAVRASVSSRKWRRPPGRKCGDAEHGPRLFEGCPARRPPPAARRPPRSRARRPCPMITAAPSAASSPPSFLLRRRRPHIAIEARVAAPSRTPGFATCLGSRRRRPAPYAAGIRARRERRRRRGGGGAITDQRRRTRLCAVPRQARVLELPQAAASPAAPR